MTTTAAATTTVALVTGASRGLGAAIARRLAADGLAVAVNYRSDRAGAEQVTASVRAAGGVAEAFAADITDETAVERLVAAVTERLGPIGVLVANATGPQPNLPVEDLTWQAHLDQLTFFVKSPTLLVQAVLPGMKERGGGRVIQIGSDIVDRKLPDTSAYTAAKAAQHALTEVWAKELGRYGITVNVVAPGWIPVERHEGVDESAYLEEVPLGRMGTPEDVAAAVSYLASDGAAFVTGRRLTVNGGHT
ncbi:3-oxoacyl-[acyl-carrier protein] reductase [[Actinomadura] parvosata subsp. kistnae]|uniref:3-oxoacyl-ACP reductase n=1 Tax=[Actinomadura] parvosata subsp. kistnae TaxID=1909395 RepID=A0A1U9ZSB1_9ACTN|nr:SDR family oxidoreductase [Nonomuraea sp. ATCC 55076]AQZ60819.1 3-oxoacyl-ACP reductase [Nonomuraea sp. ATCC 55076]SPL90538.1 3-oxoacyl-[acyl-carrier protein] reductase [Actinomadura parvosata subsp. kistnae]